MRKEFQKIVSLVKMCNGITGRKKIQKMVYILKQKGMGFTEPFIYHHFGPYSSELQIELNALVEWGILSESQQPDTSYRYSLSGEDNPENQDNEKYRNLAQYLNEQSPKVLELVSTMYYLKNKGYENFKAIQQKTLTLKPNLAHEMDNALKVYDEVESKFAIS
jgi:uncharacterized protein